MIRGVALLSLTLCGCGSVVMRADDGPSRYRLGDRIVYRYAGSLLPHEVLLEERITDVAGLRLRIEVTARRTTEAGDDVRRWIQVVTDTEDNRAADRVDELYALDADGNATRLTNDGNADLMELYAWTLPPLEWGEPGEERHATETLTLGGASYRCDVSTTALPNVGDDATVSLSECPDLVWTNGPGRVVRGAEVLWSVDVVEVTSGRP